MSTGKQHFGPYTEHVEQFFERAEHLAPAAWRRVIARYRHTQAEERERAERALIEQLLDNRSRLMHQWAAQQRVREVVVQLRARQRAERPARQRPLNVEALRVALAYAVAALVTRDLVDEATFAVLYDPFHDTIPPEPPIA